MTASTKNTAPSGTHNFHGVEPKQADDLVDHPGGALPIAHNVIQSQTSALAPTVTIAKPEAGTVCSKPPTVNSTLIGRVLQTVPLCTPREWTAKSPAAFREATSAPRWTICTRLYATNN
jgi:hypothetical protein